ncbi:MAG: hypothetical protein V1853_00370 [bacterium]
MADFLHKDLADGRWFTLSLIEQMANIGSEVSRAAKWKDKDKNIFKGAFERALDLFDLTLEDVRWIGRRFEIARARELFCAAALDADEAKEYKTTLSDLDRYFYHFAFAVANKTQAMSSKLQ